MSTSTSADRVVIGMDPHKRSATIEVMTAEETILGGGRFTTDRDGYAEMGRYAGQWPDRVWAIEGCAGFGKHIAWVDLSVSNNVPARFVDLTLAQPAPCKITKPSRKRHV